MSGKFYKEYSMDSGIKQYDTKLDSKHRVIWTPVGRYSKLTQILNQSGLMRADY